MQIVGDADATDPACSLSPHHRDLVRIAQTAQERTTNMVYRVLETTSRGPIDG